MKLQFDDPVTGKPSEIVSEEKDTFLGVIKYRLKTGRFITAPLVENQNGDNRDNFWQFARDYQKEGIEFIEKSNYRALLADDIGLGKTVQALLSVRYNQDNLLPCAVIVKSSLKYQWFIQIKKWLGNSLEKEDGPLSFIVNDGKSGLLPGFKFYIMSMDVVEKHLKSLENLGIKCLIVDESQNFKNQVSKRTVALIKLCKFVPHVIFLSGTPILNRATEYFTTLNLVNPYHWPIRAQFVRQWCDTTTTESGVLKYTGIKSWRRDEFLSRTSNYILRRKREDVLIDLPKFQRNMIVVELDDPAFKNAYKKGVITLKDLIDQSSRVKGMQRYAELMAILQKLRELTAFEKVDDCVERAEQFLNESDDSKLLIGAHHYTVISKLSESLKGYNPLILTGKQTPQEKHHAIQRFARPESRIMIASELAAGEGVDGLQYICSNGIILERQWNIAKELQFEGRLNRSGQTKPVTFDYILAHNTIDEWMTMLIENKRNWVNSAMDKSLEESNYEISIEDLANLIIGKG